MAKKSEGMTTKLMGNITFGTGGPRKQKKAKGKVSTGVSFKGGKRFKVTI